MGSPLTACLPRPSPFAACARNRCDAGLSLTDFRNRPFPIAESRDIFGTSSGEPAGIPNGGKTWLARLTARTVATAKRGKHSDGGNLYLIVSQTGSRKWVLRFTLRGTAKEMGLGSANDVPLADARERAADARRLLARDLNPIDERKRGGVIPTFGVLADDVCQTLAAGFRNEEHKAQWRMTLVTYAAPLRSKPVDTISTEDLLAVLQADLDRKAGNGIPPAGPHKKGFGSGQGQGLPHDREPSALARPPGPPPAEAS